MVGRRYRDVQCVDSQNKRPLRPFHCQAASSRPISTLTCPNKPCMTWSVSPWGPVRGLNTFNLFLIDFFFTTGTNLLHMGMFYISDFICQSFPPRATINSYFLIYKYYHIHFPYCTNANVGKWDFVPVLAKQNKARTSLKSLCFPQCSGSCGEGIRERLVYCPEPHRCSTTLKPNDTETCSLKPCTHWKTEDWEEVSHTWSRFPWGFEGISKCCLL